MKFAPIHSDSLNSNLFSAQGRSRYASRIVGMLSRAALLNVTLLGMAGCAISGAENGSWAADEETTDETSLAIDATPPVAPQDPGSAVITVCASGCSYTTLQPAIDAAQPGSTVLVKNGTYYTSDLQNPTGRKGLTVNGKNGTSTQPIALIAFPGHRPVIETLADTVTITNGVPAYRSVEPCLTINGNHWIVDGFEMQNCQYGIVVSGSNVTIRNNVIHDNALQGILVTALGGIGASDILIEQNKIYLNGTTYETTGTYPRQHCLSADTNFKPITGHCHGIYLSANGTGTTDQARITIRRNVIERHGGGGVHIFDNRPLSVYSDILIENNLLLNNQKGGLLGRYEYGANSYFRHNVVSFDAPVPLVSQQYASTNNKEIYLISPLRGAVANGMQVYGNIFYTPQSWWNVFSGMSMTHVYPVVVDTINPDAGIFAPVFADNDWAVRPGARVTDNATAGHSFTWNQQWYGNFSGEFRSATAQEATGLLPGDATFVANPFLAPTRGRYEHITNTPAIGRSPGSAARPCPSVDYTGRSRGTGACDLGAFEY